MNQAEARPRGNKNARRANNSYNKGYKAKRTVTRTKVRTTRRVSRTTHRPIRHKRTIKRIHRSHRQARRYTLKKVFSLRFLNRRARRVLNRRYSGNVQLFCLNNPGLCNVSYVKVWY